MCDLFLRLTYFNIKYFVALYKKHYLCTTKTRYIMKQSVVYDCGMKLFLFFRGGYDPVKKRALDPYNYDARPIATARGAAPSCIIKDCGGCIVHYFSTDERDTIGRFFFGDKWNAIVTKNMVVDGEWMLMFTKDGRSVFYHKGDPTPSVVRKYCETPNKFFEEWVEPYTRYSKNKPPVYITGFKFDDNQEYIVCKCGDPTELIPEYTINIGLHKNDEFFYDELFNIGIMDLSDSYDWSDTQKAEFERKILAFKEQKIVPHCCSVCGQPASYVIKPHKNNGIKQHRLVCTNCYNNLSPDI